MKVAVVSSYHRNCGVAQYIEHMEQSLRSVFDELEVIPLPVELLRASGPTAASMAKSELNSILDKIAAADVVVLEFEPGLFGRTQGRVWATVKAILKASRRVVITYHTAPMPPAPLQITLGGVKAFMVHAYRQQIFSRLLGKVRANQRGFVHIVQTGREKNRLTLLGVDASRIFDMPLAFLSREQKVELADSRHRSDLDRTIGTGGSKLLGLFGFLGGIKGTKVALKALSLLPDDYHLLVVGGIHPEGVVHGTSDQPALRDLHSQLAPDQLRGEPPGAAAARRGLLSRVHFTGAVDNLRFSELMAACDAVVLPYEEVGQTSSGPAALALDPQKPIYCTRTGAFRELGKYATDALSYFEIGNYFELAQKIANGDATTSRRRQAQARYADTVTVEQRAQLYLEAATAVCN